MTNSLQLSLLNGTIQGSNKRNLSKIGGYETVGKTDKYSMKPAHKGIPQHLQNSLGCKVHKHRCTYLIVEFKSY